MAQDMAGRFVLRRNFREPDSSLSRFHLAKERSHTFKLIVPPMLKQTGGFGRDLPVVWIGYAAPLIDLLPNGVNDCGMVVLLFLRGKPFTFVEHDLLLCS